MDVLFERFVLPANTSQWPERLAAMHPTQQRVTFDGSDSLWLGDIPINAGERFPVKLQFHLRSGVILNENEFLLHFRQFDQSDPKNVYGAVNFLVKTHADDQAQSYFVSNISQNEAGAVSVYPNPASNQLNIQLRQSKATLAKIEIFDVYGRLVLRKRQQSLGATVATIDIASLTPGVYFVKIHDRNGMDEEHKFVKK